MEKIRQFLNSTAGKLVAGLAVLVGVIAFVYSMAGNLGKPDVPGSSLTQTFICSETGKVFEYTLSLGETLPAPSPYSGKKTGVWPERCNWTADGKITAEPTHVLLEEDAGRNGPTFCQDCGRLVVRNNIEARAGVTPPPTKTEYKPRRWSEQQK